MKQPDRFDTMVGQVRWSDPDIPVMMLRLLRRQHAAYVRILRTVLRDEMYDTENYRRLRAAILAAMERYRKGTR